MSDNGTATVGTYEHDGMWFWRCGICLTFEGGYPNEPDALAGLRYHIDRRHEA